MAEAAEGSAMKKLIIGLLLVPVVASADFGSAADAVNSAASTGSLEANLDALKGGVNPATGNGLGMDTVPCGQPDADGLYHCGGQVIAQPTANPPEAANYDKSVGQVQSEAQSMMMTDDAGNLVLTSKVERPTGVVKPSDPLFANADQNDEAASGLAQTYTGCKTMTYGGTGGLTKTTAFGYKTGTSNSVHCTRSWAGQCDWHEGIVFNSGDGTKRLEHAVYTPNGSSWSKSASPVEYAHYDLAPGTTYTINMDGRVDLPQSFFYVIYDLWVANVDPKSWYIPALSINGVSVPGSVNYWGLGGKYWRYQATFQNIGSYLNEGVNIISVTTHGGGSLIETIYNMRNVHECIGKETESFACDSITTIGSKPLVSKTCLDDHNPKYFDGAPFNRSCWAQAEVYGHANTAIFTEDAQCDSLRQKGCYVTNEECLQRATEGFCANARLTFTCDEKDAAKTVDVCGDTLICTDGSCNQGPPLEEGTIQDFSQAATYAQVMKDSKNNLDPTTLSIFRGSFHECSVAKTLIGSDKCCTGGSGTLNDLGLAKCSPEEKLINDSRNAAIVTALPEYETCGASVAGVCVKKMKHHPYCIWPSKLARMIQDQGKAQLGIAINSSCSGFKVDSPNEFASVDFSKIDLSEYFADVQRNYDSTAKPSPDALIQKMTDKLPEMTQDLTDRYKDYGQ